jgi:hypothetical protein
MKRRRGSLSAAIRSLWDYLALAFALMNGEGVVETVYHLIREFGEQVAENPLFGAVSEDFINAL